MELYRGARAQLPTAEGAWAVTLGTFDGVHRGHQAILHQARATARAHGLRGAVALSFSTHPRAVLDPAHEPSLLTTLDERIGLIAATGVDRLVLLDFDHELASLEYDAFVREILRARLGMAHFVLGHDMHFGRGRGGTVSTVTALGDREGFGVSQVPSVREGGEPISSSRIRRVLAEGRVEEAALLLGHPWAISGRVVHGRGDGRKLGAPTANLDWGDATKLLPRDGVYCGWARVGGEGAWREAATNIGVAPTMAEDGPRRVEVHLLDGADDLYGQAIEFAVAHRLRDEERFEGPGELVAQIRRDVERARKLLGEAAPWSRPGRLARLEPPPAPPA